MPSPFALNAALAPRVRLVGRERHPVLVLDDLAAHPDELVADARAKDFAPRADSAYPGIRAPAPEAYLEALTGLAPLFSETFRLPFTSVRFIQTVYSIVTTRPQDLRPEQRIPHVDTADPRQIAILHYLCAPTHGGVSFYRHIPTGWESLDADRQKIYDAQMQDAYASRPQRYMGKDDDLFLQIGAFDAVFNRAVIFRSRMLHSGNIGPDATLASTADEGRLTATIFCALE